jgi:chromosome segregation ATPase
MNRYYIIVPIVLMAVFVYFERDASQEAAQKEQQKIAVENKRKDDEAAKKAELEQKAKIDSEKRNAQRVKDEQEKEEKRKADYQVKIQKLKDDLKKYVDDVDSNTKLVTRLEKELSEKRDLRERENRAIFEFAKKVEISKKMRRDAELEVQRYNEMLVRRANESVLVNPPVVAAVVTK